MADERKDGQAPEQPGQGTQPPAPQTQRQLRGLYGKVNIPVKTLDRIILVLCAALVLALLPAPARAELHDAFPEALGVSALTGDGLNALLRRLEELLLQPHPLAIPVFPDDIPPLLQ